MARSVAGLEIDTEGREVSVYGVEIPLKRKEFDLLVFLVRNAGIVVTRPQIIEEVWGMGYGGDDRTVDVHVRRLRQKLPPGISALIVTYHGIGYKVKWSKRRST